MMEQRPDYARKMWGVQGRRYVELPALMWPGATDPIGYVRVGPEHQDLHVVIDRLAVERQGLDLYDVTTRVQLDMTRRFYHGLLARGVSEEAAQTSRAVVRRDVSDTVLTLMLRLPAVDGPAAQAPRAPSAA